MDYEVQRCHAHVDIGALDYLCSLLFFFFNDTATTEIYTLSLHDALPISPRHRAGRRPPPPAAPRPRRDRKSTRLNSSHVEISYAVFCLKKKKNLLIIHRNAQERLINSPIQNILASL